MWASISVFTIKANGMQVKLGHGNGYLMGGYTRTPLSVYFKSYGEGGVLNWCV